MDTAENIQNIQSIWPAEESKSSSAGQSTSLPSPLS